jgi:thiol-disulfide isomerase/thioredoxin
MNPTIPTPVGRRLSARFGVAAVVLALALLAGLPRSVGAQDVSLSCLSGARLNEADMARGTTIVVVWASWSPRSRDIVERVTPLASRWGSRARVLTVNFQEDRPTVEGFLRGRNLGAPICMDPDGAFSRKYNVATLPGLLIVKDGQVAYRGKLPDDADRVIADLLR